MDALISEVLYRIWRRRRNDTRHHLRERLEVLVESNYRAVIESETCRVCVIGCPEKAIVMEPVLEEGWFYVPSSMAEWEEMCLEYLTAHGNTV